MHLSKTLVSCISTILLMRISFAQNVRSVKSSNTDSCNVVNVYVGNKDDQTDTPEGKVPGSQGKRGPAGPVGSRGEKVSVGKCISAIDMTGGRVYMSNFGSSVNHNIGASNVNNMSSALNMSTPKLKLKV